MKLLSRIATVTIASSLAFPGTAGSQEVVPLPAEDRPIRLNLEELYSVGGIDAEEWEAFQTLDGAAFGPDGVLYLLDASSALVVAVRDGALSHRVGRRGDGPGEYRSPGDVVTLPDGSVTVWDEGKEAFVSFASDGSPLEQEAPDYALGVPTAPLKVLGDGSVVGLPQHLISGRRGAIYRTSEGYRSAEAGLPLLRYPVRRGASGVELARVPTLQGGAVDPATRAFVPQPSWGALAGDRIALIDSDRYEVKVFDRDGTHVRTLRRPIEARPTTSDDEALFLRFVRDRYERSLRTGRGLRPVEPSGEVNAHPVIPPVLGLSTDGGGRIWVQRRAPENPLLAGPIDLLGVDGEYLGTVTDGSLGLPAAFGSEGLVVFLTVGELDVPVARVFRLPVGLR